MKKKAYTLAEVLLTLAIIGVLATVTIPLVGHIKPDKNKMLYHKAYNTLAANVHKIAKDISLYDKHMTGNGNIYNVSRYPLYNMEKPSNPKYSGNQGYSKLGNIIKDLMQGEGTYKEFKTKNGMIWRIDDTYVYENQGDIISYTRVEVDVDGKDNGPNHYYEPNKFTGKPDTFVFYITASGEIIPGDLCGQLYMKQRKDYKRKKDSELKSDIETKKTKGEIVDLTNTNNRDLDAKATFKEEEIRVQFNSDSGDMSGSSSHNLATPGPNSGTPPPNSGTPNTPTYGDNSGDENQETYYWFPCPGHDDHDYYHDHSLVEGYDGYCHY